MPDPQGVTLSLDQLADDPGDILVRDGNEWIGLAPGAADEVLTSQGPGLLPQWTPLAAGGIWSMPLLNPGAEDGVGTTLDIWVQDNNTPRRNPPPGSPPPVVQAGLFRFYAGTTNLAQLSQVVDVPASAEATIDALTAWAVTNWWCAGPVNDLGRLRHEFQDASGTPIGTIVSPYWDRSNGVNTWRPRGMVEPIPALTRKIRYILNWDRVTGSSSDYYIDSIKPYIVELGAVP